jgi:hypothetical protein
MTCWLRGHLCAATVRCGAMTPGSGVHAPMIPQESCLVEAGTPTLCSQIPGGHRSTCDYTLSMSPELATEARLITPCNMREEAAPATGTASLQPKLD